MQETIVSALLRTVELHNGKTAVEYRGESRSYSGLLSNVAVLAGGVADTIGSPGPRQVAILMKKGIRQVEALLAVQFAGHCFVPVSSVWPVDYLSSVLEDSESALLLCDESTRRTAEHLSRATRVPLLETAAARADRYPGFHPPEIKPADRAYIIYTSGSTGAPKGVVQTHETVLHNVEKYSRSLELSSSDRISMLSDIAYAASMSDLYGALLSGAVLLPFSMEDSSMQALSEWLGRSRVSVLFMVPTLFRMLMKTMPDACSLPSLRVFKLAGEALRKHDVDDFFRVFPKTCRLLNSLGQSELNCIAHYFIDSPADIDSSLVPVGFPCPDTTLLVVDRNGAELACGREGILAVDTPVLSPGYWRRPELTSRFFRDGPKGMRRLLTSDIARFDGQGRLILLGRADQRLKIGGVSVDPAQVEDLLTRCEGVSDAVVLPGPLVGGRETMAAYVTGDCGLFDPATIRKQLLARLPGHAVPGRIELLSDFPRLPSGKTDRSALLVMAKRRGRYTPRRHTAARDPLDDTLIVLWESALGFRPVGIDDDFFEIGGNSLAALDVLTEVRKIFGAQIDLSYFITHPTIRRFRRGLDDRDWLLPTPLIVPLEKSDKALGLYLVHPLGGNILCYARLARLLAEKYSTFAVRALGLCPGESPSESIEEMGRVYAEAVSKHADERSCCLGGWSAGGVIALETARRLIDTGVNVRAVFLFDPRWPGELAAMRLVMPEETVVKVKMWYGRVLHHMKRIRTLKPSRWLPYLKEKLGVFYRHRHMPQSFPGRSVRRVVKNALRSYRPRRFPFPVVFFRADADGVEKWEKLSDDKFTLIEVGGGHMDILEEPVVGNIARHILDYTG